jgi:hypothetical protein
LYIIVFNVKYKQDKNIPTSIHVKLFSYLAKFENLIIVSVYQVLLLPFLPKYLFQGEFMLLYCSFRTSSFLFIVSIDPNRLHASAYFATILSLFLSPLPPTNMGGEGLCCSILYS